MITVIPRGGLCNRLRVVASSLEFAGACRQPLQVVWYRSRDMNARFDVLFEIREVPFGLIERNGMIPALRVLRDRSRAVLAGLRGAVVLGDRETQPGIFRLNDIVARVGNRDVLVETNSCLAHVPGMFDVFRPTAPVTDRIATLLPRLRRSVGVHIRRTDNVRATLVSTLDAFAALMLAECGHDDDVEFFVATDDGAVFRQLRRDFGPRVWEYPKRAYRRDDPAGIVDALIDLLALASCRKVIGSHWSSFTDTAAEWGNVPLQIAGIEA